MQLDYFAIFLIGFLNSFGHCIGMCGGFVVAYSLKINPTGKNRSIVYWPAVYPHLLFNIGRVITYTFMGFCFGLIGETFGIILSIRNFQGGVEILAGLVIILMGLELGNWIPFDSTRYVPGITVIKNLINGMIRRVKRQNILFLGLALGFIPCGLVYAAGAKAAATQSVWGGMLTMFVFGLGTMPAMILVGMSSNLISTRFRQQLFRFATILVILMGILSVYRGVRAIINPTLQRHNHASVACVITDQV